MRYNLHYLILGLITGLLLSSCTGSLVKRKYNKGYYLSHSHKLTQPKEQTPLAVMEKPRSIPELKESAIAPELKTAPEEEMVFASAPDAKADKVTGTKETPKLTRAAFRTIETIAPKKWSQELKAKEPQAGLVAATLSLFWIVLVVILVIYLLGLAFDTFGIGNLFHLLAVIFLVLLILWLLGVV
jgi:hypothetical protein